MVRERRGNVIRGKFGSRRRSRWTNEHAYSTSQRQRGAIGWAAFLPLWGGAALLGTAYGAGWFEKIGPDGMAAPSDLVSASGTRASFDFCHTGAGYNCVVDGDTIWLRGEKIRLADIDAPETHDFRCPSEKELGDRATRRLHDLLESGLITSQSIDRDEDRYGRKLRIVLVNGQSVGDVLVYEGLARYYGSGRRPWC